MERAVYAILEYLDKLREQGRPELGRAAEIISTTCGVSLAKNMDLSIKPATIETIITASSNGQSASDKGKTLAPDIPSFQDRRKLFEMKTDTQQVSPTTTPRGRARSNTVTTCTAPPIDLSGIPPRSSSPTPKVVTFVDSPTSGRRVKATPTSSPNPTPPVSPAVPRRFQSALPTTSPAPASPILRTNTSTIITPTVTVTPPTSPKIAASPQTTSNASSDRRSLSMSSDHAVRHDLLAKFENNASVDPQWLSTELEGMSRDDMAKLVTAMMVMRAQEAKTHNREASPKASPILSPDDAIKATDTDSSSSRGSETSSTKSTASAGPAKPTRRVQRARSLPEMTTAQYSPFSRFRGVSTVQHDARVYKNLSHSFRHSMHPQYSPSLGSMSSGSKVPRLNTTVTRNPLYGRESLLTPTGSLYVLEKSKQFMNASSGGVTDNLIRRLSRASREAPRVIANPLYGMQSQLSRIARSRSTTTSADLSALASDAETPGRADTETKAPEAQAAASFPITSSFSKSLSALSPSSTNKHATVPVGMKHTPPLLISKLSSLPPSSPGKSSPAGGSPRPVRASPLLTTSVDRARSYEVSSPPPLDLLSSSSSSSSASISPSPSPASSPFHLHMHSDATSSPPSIVPSSLDDYSTGNYTSEQSHSTALVSPIMLATSRRSSFLNDDDDESGVLPLPRTPSMRSNRAHRRTPSSTPSSPSQPKRRMSDLEPRSRRSITIVPEDQIRGPADPDPEHGDDDALASTTATDDASQEPRPRPGRSPNVLVPYLLDPSMPDTSVLLARIVMLRPYMTPSAIIDYLTEHRTEVIPQRALLFLSMWLRNCYSRDFSGDKALRERIHSLVDALVLTPSPHKDVAAALSPSGDKVRPITSPRSLTTPSLLLSAKTLSTPSSPSGSFLNLSSRGSAGSLNYELSDLGASIKSFMLAAQLAPDVLLTSLAVYLPTPTSPPSPSSPQAHTHTSSPLASLHTSSRHISSLLASLTSSPSPPASPSVPHTPTSPVPSPPPPPFEFQHCRITELAKWLTHIEATMFRKVEVGDLLPPRTGPNGSQVIQAIIARFNDIAGWVATEVVRTSQIRRRVAILTKFIQLGKILCEMGNYNSLMEVLAGLNMHPVQRLHITWAGLSPSWMRSWRRLNKLMGHHSNYRRYRSVLASRLAGNTLPYFGLFLRDLTFIETASPALIDPPVLLEQQQELSSSLSLSPHAPPHQIPSPDRSQLTAQFITSLHFYQQAAHGFCNSSPPPIKLHQLLHLSAESEDMLMRYSLWCEPRTAPAEY
eukprot:TRINITY_DN6279_c0_g1_i6.p1 TRINITY_DN6279_c0_g1~~TRINITY_DN6279_c0_g1_i6.p1  ORF type:complete len:1281 (-),score=298.73 TRINITY_DN6279_c0_g1_i6:220-4062(-)